MFALRGVLPYARRLGLHRLLVTCDDDNVASSETIEQAGGVLERIRPPDHSSVSLGFDKPLRRYRITV